MATTVDTLITKYVLDDKQYTQGADNVTAATGGIGTKMAGVARIAAFATTAIVAVGAAAIAVGKRASQTAAGFEVMEKSLATVTGSMSRASEVFEFVKKQAGPSAFFGVKELGNAAQLLETFSLKTERFLPLANTMASLFGQNAESLNSFVMALGRIKAGSFGEGFQRLREMGITRPMLEAQGLKFNKGGQFEGTPEEALRGIEAAIKLSFGDLDKQMAGTFQAQMASVGDATERIFAELGIGINDKLLPKVTAFGDELNYLVESGRMREAGDVMGSMIESLDNFGKSLTSFFDKLPLTSLPKWIAEQINGRSSFDPRAMDEQTKKMQEDPRFQRVMRTFEEAASKGGGKYGASEGEAEAVAIERTNTVFLGEIAKNTKQSVELQRIALGAGGGSVGITPVELSDMKNRRTGRVAVAVEALVSAIAREMITASQDQSATRRAAFVR